MEGPEKPQNDDSSTSPDPGYLATYLGKFGKKDEKIPPEVLRLAHDVRKFEIDLYWKRATYFFAFIGSAFVGYGVLLRSSQETDAPLRLVVSCIGIVAALAWVLVNKGSKQWQENWESHVDLLEDKTVGPLYKLILRSKARTKREKISQILLGPAAYSASKLNLILSEFVLALWAVAWLRELSRFFPELYSDLGLVAIEVAVVVLSLVAMVSLLFTGKTGSGKKQLVVKERVTELTEWET